MGFCFPLFFEWDLADVETDMTGLKSETWKNMKTEPKELEMQKICFQENNKFSVLMMPLTNTYLQAYVASDTMHTVAHI